MTNIVWHKKTKDAEAQQELKRRAVLEVAARLFSTIGYKKTSLDLISAELELTKPALYYYARNKEDILMQCAQVSLERVAACFGEAQNANGSGLKKLQEFFRAYAVLVVSDFGSSLMREARRNLTGHNQKNLRQTLRDGQQYLEQIIAEGIEDKSIRNCSTKRVAQILFSAFNQMPEWYEKTGLLQPRQIADEILVVVIGGISAQE